ncbi:hypothetical protein [Lentzea sp. E54]|uniref:hypothetical protein n=1 Tax=Lentzea xerophila TaxID=3435883 RepID=UPI003DA3E14B
MPKNEIESQADVFADLPVELDGGVLADLMRSFERTRRQLSLRYGGAGVPPGAWPELVAVLEGQRSLLARIRAEVRAQSLLLAPLTSRLGVSRVEGLFLDFEAEIDRVRASWARSGHDVHVRTDAGETWTGLTELDVTEVGEHIDELYLALEPLSHVPIIAASIEDLSRFQTTLHTAVGIWNRWPAVRSGTEAEWQEALEDREAVTDVLDVALESLSVLLAGATTANGPQWTVPRLVGWADYTLGCLEQVDEWAADFADSLWQDIEELTASVVDLDVRHSRLR